MSEVDETPQQDPMPQPSLRQALTAALGLPAETFMVEFLLGETTPPIVRCHYYPTPAALHHAVVVFAEYELVAKRPPPPDIVPEIVEAPEEQQDRG